MTAASDRRHASLIGIVDVTLEAIAESGADAVSLSDVSMRAGISRPTAYSLVGSADGALAEVWQEVGVRWVSHQAHEGFSDGEFGESVRSALADLVLTAPRHPEVLEVMQRHLRLIWDELEAAGESALLRWVWTMAAEVGAEASAGVGGHVAAGRAFLQRIAMLPADARNLVGLTGVDWPPISNAAEPPAVKVDEGDILGRLIVAAIDVVNSSGVSGASMLRICRVAGLTTGAARPRFRDVEDLILATFDRFTTSVVETNVGTLRSTMAEASLVDIYAELVRSGLSEPRARWRRFRQEMFVASRSSPVFKEALRNSVSQSEELMERRLTSAPVGIPRKDVHVLLGLNQIMAVGVPALHAVGLPVAELDHRIPLRWLYTG